MLVCERQPKHTITFGGEASTNEQAMRRDGISKFSVSKLSPSGERVIMDVSGNLRMP
jgi:hypothetical protein